MDDGVDASSSLPRASQRRPTTCGSMVGKAPNKDQHRQAGALLLHSDYFMDNVANSPKEFRGYFRMNKELFMRIVFGIRKYNDYFMCKKDCTDLCGFSSVQKHTFKKYKL
jgi:hypothetical protein